MNGADLYAVIVSALTPKAGAGIAEMQKHLRKLASLGIPGIRYLDQGSRGAGDGTRNFVIFDENLCPHPRRERQACCAGDFSLRVTPAQDAEYMAAVKAGDMETAQRWWMRRQKRLATMWGLCGMAQTREFTTFKRDGFALFFLFSRPRLCRKNMALD